MAEYQHDLFSQNVAALPETDDGKRNLVDIAEFVLWFGGARTNAQLQNEFQDITNVHIDATRAIDMYRRFAREALSVFSNYPGVQAIL